MTHIQHTGGDCVDMHASVAAGKWPLACVFLCPGNAKACSRMWIGICCPPCGSSVSGRMSTCLCPPVVVRMLAGVLGVLLAPEARVLQRMGSGWGQGHPARGLLMAAAGGSSERGLQVKLA